MVYGWVRNYVSPNSKLNLAQDTSTLDGLIVQTKAARTKRTTGFAEFLIARKGSLPGIMTDEGKSDIGEWMRRARQMYEALPQEAKDRYETQARKMNEFKAMDEPELPTIARSL